MLDQDVAIVTMVEDTKYERDGTRVPWMRIEFMVGKLGPFTERIPKADYSALVRDDKLNSFAREVRTT